LAAQGYTNLEIAEQTGFTTVMVAYVKKQPWALQFIADLQERGGRKAVDGVLSGAALEAAKTLIDVMDGTILARPEARVKAANDILNRLYPVASLHIHGKVDPADLSDEELANTVATGNS
jgi:hypothetical protein